MSSEDREFDDKADVLEVGGWCVGGGWVVADGTLGYLNPEVQSR